MADKSRRRRYSVVRASGVFGIAVDVQHFAFLFRHPYTRISKIIKYDFALQNRNNNRDDNVAPRR